MASPQAVVNMDGDTGGNKRNANSPLEAEHAKKAYVHHSPGSDASFNELMSTLSDVNASCSEFTHTPDTAPYYSVSGSQHSHLPLVAMSSQPAYPGYLSGYRPPAPRHPWQQQLQQHQHITSSHMMFQQQGGHGNPRPTYIPPPTYLPATHPGQPAGGLMGPRPPFPTMTSTQQQQQQAGHATSSSPPASQPVYLGTATFASTLATALQSVEVRDSLGDIIQDRLETLTDNYETRLRELESKSLKLELENKTLRTRLDSAEAAIDELEQYGRRNALRVSNNWPEADQENTDTLIINMAHDHLGIDLQPSDISRSHRVGPPSAPKPRPVLVKFSTYRARERIFRARSKLKNSDSGIYLNEDLTKKRGQLAYAARKMKRELTITDTWTYDCRVFAKNKAGSVIVVNDICQLERHAGLNQHQR